MNIQNFSLLKNDKRNNPLLPSSLRCLIVGRSNCGKTNLLVNLLLQDGWLDYDRLIVFGNSLHQDEYQILKQGIEKKLSKRQILNLIENQKLMKPLDALKYYEGTGNSKITAEFHENCDEIPDPKELDSTKKNLLILDDCYLGKMSKAGAYFSRGRHNGVNCIFISQNYFALERKSVRENSNLIILFEQNAKSVQHIYQDHCTDIPFEEFKALCQHIWSVKYDFLTIDLSSGILEGKYRKNLDQFFTPEKYSGKPMSFTLIKNPKKRDEMVKDYIQIKKDIKQENEAKRESASLRDSALEAKYKPIITATEKSAEKIAKAAEVTPYEYYSKNTINRDKFFCIYRSKEDTYVLGNEKIKIDDQNTIHIKDKTWEYTIGLWNLIMLNNPVLTEYTDKDLGNYIDIAEFTDLINNPRVIPGKPYNTQKYKFLKKYFGESIEESEEEAQPPAKRKKADGEGVILPGDINSLQKRLQLLIAEREAGNVDATTPEIVAILDEFLRRKRLTRPEYNAVCKELKC